MKTFLRQQLDRYAFRLAELDFLLSREDIMSDMKQFLALSREHTEVAAIASRYARWQQRQADLATGQEMLESSADDAEMLAMAQDEISAAQQECEQLEAELQVLRAVLAEPRRRDARHARPQLSDVKLQTALGLDVCAPLLIARLGRLSGRDEVLELADELIARVRPR